MTALVIAEHDNASVRNATLNTVTAALQCDDDVHVLIAGANSGAAAAVAARIHGVARVLHADAAWLDHRLVENVAAQVVSLAARYNHLLFPATAAGRTVASRVAARLDVRRNPDGEQSLGGGTLQRRNGTRGASTGDQGLGAIKVTTVHAGAFGPAIFNGSRAVIEMIDTSMEAPC